ncbi:ion transporter [Xylella fastidiosa subsp. pauca]|uniref:ion transporter n=1 Tax=Xylella fastidiosa TaxID=2371 RepID=UPI000582D739|nr:ion transporter [Xylella fastidiosa]ARO68923.1 ion transporter [Xylella fastidiosa subsp. pauca]AVI20983.1 ion transporter [Xylella fastidiosa]AVI23011.1 ion transporter [Xylella fastidiosa]KIA58170.1 ion transporter [Xylella fastidiosa]KXB10137.1 ion transporter [Xylella fastidiosa]
MPLLFDSQMTPITNSGWRRHWFEIVYRHDTPPSRNFDLLLMLAILGSVLVVMLDSVLILQAHWKDFLYTLEWLFTLIFTADYLIRLVVVQQRLRYVLSIWGIIDLLSILPTYLSLFMPGTQSLLIVRVLRLLRLFRILKMTHYVEESGELVQALWRSRRKVMLFICTVMTIAMIAGATMYVIEGPQHGFTSIPTGMYWAIVTMTTVGFGDITPQSTLGRFVTSALILIGYSIIAVPTGIYTAELTQGLLRSEEEHRHDMRTCPHCGLQGHDRDARYCRNCGGILPETLHEPNPATQQ